MIFKKDALKKIQAREVREFDHTILIVDDERENLYTLSEYLSNYFEVIVAASGQEALELIRKRSEPIHLIISDQRMPKMNGVDFLAETLPLLPEAKRVILSAYADVNAVIAAIRRVQIYEFILKPYDNHKLMLTIRRALEARDLELKNAAITAELRDLNRNLELKVKERTFELEEKNRDILRAQRQLVHQEKMASLGTLTAGIAHELRNPLNFINNMSGIMVNLCHEARAELESADEEAALRKSAFDLLDDLRQNASVIQNHGDRAATIIKSMLELSRVGPGEKQLVDFNLLVEEYCVLAYLSKKGHQEDFPIRFAKNLTGDMPGLEMAPRSMSRVWVHLINNAIESLLEKIDQQGDHFQPLVRVTTENHPDKVCVIIRDNGMGITPEHQNEIFHPFFTTRPPGSGNIGMGLAICHDIIVNGHHGEIVIDTRPQEYTEIRVSLPKPS